MRVNAYEKALLLVFLTAACCLDGECYTVPLMIFCISGIALVADLYSHGWYRGI